MGQLGPRPLDPVDRFRALQAYLELVSEADVMAAPALEGITPRSGGPAGTREDPDGLQQPVSRGIAWNDSDEGPPGQASQKFGRVERVPGRADGRVGRLEVERCGEDGQIGLVGENFTIWIDPEESNGYPMQEFAGSGASVDKQRFLDMGCDVYEESKFGFHVRDPFGMVYHVWVENDEKGPL